MVLDIHRLDSEKNSEICNKFTIKCSGHHAFHIQMPEYWFLIYTDVLLDTEDIRSNQADARGGRQTVAAGGGFNLSDAGS